MTKHLLIAAIAFAVGALLATVVRTALHRPVAVAPMASEHEHAAMATPTTTAAVAATVPAMAPAVTAVPAAAPINTVCPVCGMPVRTAIPPATWQGVLVGFGCSTCPADFAEKPDVYGAAARLNQKAQ